MSGVVEAHIPLTAAVDARTVVRAQIAAAVRRAMSEQDRDPYSPTHGCFDRRYWGWKLADMPEAALQRNAQPLAAVLVDPESPYYRDDRVRAAVCAGVRFATRIQRRDGSFDQAFPYERSVGVTAFLLHCFIDILSCAGGELDTQTRQLAEVAARRAADFLCRYDEAHGVIANHQAAAALALSMASEYCHEPRYADRAAQHANQVFRNQSAEGWFLEYEGADPGYQSLCLYYLALLAESQPRMVPASALERALGFLSYCVHPDGTFGGDYGARRTATYHPGGIALLGGQFPVAAAMTRFMHESIARGFTTTLPDVDMGNLAPLFSSYVLMDRHWAPSQPNGLMPQLPCETVIELDLPEAGLFFRSTPAYYAVLGASNGGVLKVFDKLTARAVYDDGGYAGALAGGRLVSTQVTDRGRLVSVDGDSIEIEAPFYDVLQAVPTPPLFILLRIASLTVMRVGWIAEHVKKGLVRLLVTGKRRRNATLRRRVRFAAAEVTIDDVVEVARSVRFEWLACGCRFTAIHMASAKYFEGALPPVTGLRPVGIRALAESGRATLHFVAPASQQVPIGYDGHGSNPG